jgi:hypothetical protein
MAFDCFFELPRESGGHSKAVPWERMVDERVAEAVWSEEIHRRTNIRQSDQACYR